MIESINYKPIGLFSCSQTSPVESPRQGVLAKQSQGLINLNSDIDVLSLQDLLGFERIWLLYDFHKNTDWHPMVRPPRGALKKRGVFATRSPYRPNSIGLSCVRLGEIKKGVIQVFEHDLLDQTPILDIKPYLPYSDSFPDAKIGWLQDIKKYDVEFSVSAGLKMNWLEKKLDINLKSIVENQLEFEPTNKKIKRVRFCEDYFEYSYKTWRIQFKILNEKIVSVFNIQSGYTIVELAEIHDPYGDKEVHKIFASLKF